MLKDLRHCQQKLTRTSHVPLPRHLPPSTVPAYGLYSLGNGVWGPFECLERGEP